MKRLLVTSVVAVALTAGVAMAASAPAMNVGVVNYMTVFQQVPQGNATLNKMKADLAPKVAALKAEQSKLEQQVQTLDRNAPTMSQDARDAQEKQLMAQQDSFQQQVQQLQQAEAQKEQAAAAAFNTDMQNAITTVAKKNNLTLVFNSQAVPYTDPGFDVTSQVVAVMQSEK